MGSIEMFTPKIITVHPSLIPGSDHGPDLGSNHALYQRTHVVEA
jgi:hypothetical protein